MKKFNKLVVSILVLATLGVTSLTPLTSNAYVDKNGTFWSDEYLAKCEANSLKEAVFIVEDGEYSCTYYLNMGKLYADDTYNGTCQYDTIDKSLDLSSVENTFIIENSTSSQKNFLADCGSHYDSMGYDYDTHEWFYLANSIPKTSTVGDSSIVGDSNNLYDEPTNIRGDVNYDGKVNVIDVMTLRRYLLHLLEW